jgi:hypothetical protein
MWTPHITPLANTRGSHVIINGDAKSLAYQDVLSEWQHNRAFRALFINLLATSPYKAFRWETPPVTRAIAHRPFECVLLDSPDLIQDPDTHTFADHFSTASHRSIVEFSNLSNDAWLIVPCPEAAPTAYPNIGAFIRHAPDSQRHDLFKAVGAALENRLDQTPIWLSTSGGGVSWLHVRLDTYPKYYRHDPYRHVS